jgi:hypothetical protein
VVKVKILLSEDNWTYTSATGQLYNSNGFCINVVNYQTKITPFCEPIDPCEENPDAEGCKEEDGENGGGGQELPPFGGEEGDTGEDEGDTGGDGDNRDGGEEGGNDEQQGDEGSE